MGFTTLRLNELADSIASELVNVGVAQETWVSVVNYLDNNISIEAQPTQVSTTLKALAWPPASGGEITTSNTVASANELNFSIETSKNARTIYFLSGSIVTAVMELVSPITTGIYGGGLFLDYIKMSLSEAVII